jgi:hypothetical protein
MKNELAKKWLGKLTKLNAATASGKCRGKDTAVMTAVRGWRAKSLSNKGRRWWRAVAGSGIGRWTRCMVAGRRVW